MNGTLNATTKGCVYQNDYPVALLVGGTLRVVGGQVTATSDGRNGNDGCQGYGIKANVLEIGGGGTVRAYSNGYSTETNRCLLYTSAMAASRSTRTIWETACLRGA